MGFVAAYFILFFCLGGVGLLHPKKMKLDPVATVKVLFCM
jgi:hypothetical protein